MPHVTHQTVFCSRGSCMLRCSISLVFFPFWRARTSHLNRKARSEPRPLQPINPPLAPSARYLTFRSIRLSGPRLLQEFSGSLLRCWVVVGLLLKVLGSLTLPAAHSAQVTSRLLRLLAPLCGFRCAGRWVLAASGDERLRKEGRPVQSDGRVHQVGCSLGLHSKPVIF